MLCWCSLETYKCTFISFTHAHMHMHTHNTEMGERKGEWKDGRREGEGERHALCEYISSI